MGLLAVKVLFPVYETIKIASIYFKVILNKPIDIVDEKCSISDFPKCGNLIFLSHLLVAWEFLQIEMADGFF